MLGTDPAMIDSAEDRHKFSSILDSIGVDQPEWCEVTSLTAAKEFADKVGSVHSVNCYAMHGTHFFVSYPVLIRPSYVLSGAAMNVVYEESTLEYNLSAAANVSPLHPVVITKFIDAAQEIDVDAVAHQGKLIIHAVSEHVENAGVHSGDATLVLPPFSLPEEDMARLKQIAEKVATAFEISGPFNMQIIRKASQNPEEPSVLKVIECNLRASRSFPFVSKVLGTNFIDVATAAIVGQDVPEPVDAMAEKRDYTAIKVSQFSWTRLGGADPFLGVGESISICTICTLSSNTALSASQRWRVRVKSRVSARTSMKPTGPLFSVPQGSRYPAQTAACLSVVTSRNLR